jgi:hypothetical protein
MAHEGGAFYPARALHRVISRSSSDESCAGVAGPASGREMGQDRAMAMVTTKALFMAVCGYCHPRDRPRRLPPATWGQYFKASRLFDSKLL